MIAFLIILATIICTLLGGFFALKFKDQLHLILGFSAGAVLGVTLFDLIPESIKLGGKTYSPEILMVWVAAGFAFYLILDRFFSIHCDDPHECKNIGHNFSFGPVALTLHSILDGLGVGLAFKVSPTIGWVVALAVLAHKFSDGINIAGMVLRDKGSQKSTLGWLIANSVAPGIGFVASLFLNISEPILGLGLAFFVGLFLYISASDLIPESHHHHPTAATTLVTLLGMGIIYLTTLFA